MTLPVSKAALYINSLVLYLTEAVHIWQNHVFSEETEFSVNVFFSQNRENDLLYSIPLEQVVAISPKAKPVQW